MVTQLLQGDRQIGVRVRYPAQYRSDLAHLAADGMGKVESSLGAMSGVAADTYRKMDELSASSRSMQAIVREIDRALEQFELEKAGSVASVSVLPQELRRLEHESQPLPLSLGIVPVLSPDEDAVQEGEAIDLEPGREVGDRDVLKAQPSAAEARNSSVPEVLEELESEEKS